MPKLADNKSCTACMTCMNICPVQAITQVSYADGHRGISVKTHVCIECGACERVCPVVNGSTYGENSLDSEYYAGWATKPEIRHRGATSGIFGALAETVISQGGYIAGVVMDHIFCRYILSDKYEDIKRMQGSKYTSSDPGFIYKEIRRKLSEGVKVLFCGLPCHVAGLLEYLPNHLKVHLITVDIICGGVSSPMLIKRYAEHVGDMIEILSFRDKNNGWKPTGFHYSLKYVNKDSSVVDTSAKGRNLITDGFSCELTDRYSCYNCKFAFTHRKSDLTIGDLWGDTEYKDQHFNGVSGIIAHSIKGKEALVKSGIEFHPITQDRLLLNNYRIYNGKSIKRWFPERHWLAYALHNLSYDSLLKVYGSDLKPIRLLWIPFTIYRLLSFRLSAFLNKRRGNRILKQIKQSRSKC